jgi:hypothetical protein
MPHKTQRGAILEAIEEYAREGLQTIPSNSYAAEAHFAKLMRQLFYLWQLWPRWTPNPSERGNGKRTAR